MNKLITTAAIAAVAGSASAQVGGIDPTETYEIFTLIGAGTTLEAFIDPLPDSAVFDGAPEDAGVGDGINYFTDESVVSNADGTFTATVFMFAQDDREEFTPFIPAALDADGRDLLFITLGQTVAGGSGDGIGVTDLQSIEAYGLGLIDLDGNLFAPDAADYSLSLFNPGPFDASDGELNVNIGITALDGAIAGDDFAGFFLNITYVPTPSAAALLGLAGFAGLRRRR
jgi:uncharacterized protein (TIGR03382 family)